MRARLTPRRLALIGLLFCGLAYATLIQSFSWNQTSHYALIRSLDNDTAIIDRYQDQTGDKARYRRHFYSARAPGIALFSLPWYRVLVDIGVPDWAQKHVPPVQRPGDDMIWAVGLWGAVLPGLVLLLLVWRLGERFEAGYGAIAALTLGLGTLILPLSTLLFSHVFTACLAFAAFALLVRERDGPPRTWPLLVAGVLIGYGISSEYPIYFAGVVLGVYALARRDCLRAGPLVLRALAYGGGALVGVVPLLLYNHFAFGSWTHIAYADIPRQKAGFFGIGTPSLSTLATLLLDSRGLLTLAPVLLMALVGIALLWRRGRRAEAAAIGAIAICYLGYNSGYYLPFGGGSPGPRFLTTVLPFLGVPLAVAYRRFPAPTLALAGASATAMIIATLTHPLVGYETETVTWVRLLDHGSFQPTIASAYGAGRGWLGIAPTLAAMALAIGLVVAATPRMRLSLRALGSGVAAAGLWAAFAAFAPAALGIDHTALRKIVSAGDPTATHKPWPSHPLEHLVLIALVAALLSLLVAWLGRDRGERIAAPSRSGGRSRMLAGASSR